MTEKQLSCEMILKWLDEVEKLMPSHTRHLAREQFEKVKRFIVAHKNKAEHALKFSEDYELFSELSSRFEAVDFIGSRQPVKSSHNEEYLHMTRGTRSQCLGLLQVAEELLKNELPMD